MDAEDSRALKRLSESQEDKASKKQNLDEKVEELKKHLMIVPNDEDDAYTEATPLALKIITFTTTQLILLVERKYPLIRITLEQMLNNVRLKVEEESEVSLELLSRSFGLYQSITYQPADRIWSLKLQSWVQPITTATGQPSILSPAVQQNSRHTHVVLTQARQTLSLVIAKAAFSSNGLPLPTGFCYASSEPRIEYGPNVMYTTLP
uniref:Uncharacterized protein n=1 Tax=Tanacetum cinerariifolium TaxID=118510 RepID=A0A6L2KNW1_TANCI|nr:hypothetical protein [Tanacetum cinerariifolium]